MIARFGPAGNCNAFYEAGNTATVQQPTWLRQWDLNAYEYQCGRGVRLSDKTAVALRAAAAENDVQLSLHAPYFISLASAEPEKRENSVRYILESAAAVQKLGGDRIVAAVAANAKYKGPIIIADMGTATTLDVVDHDGNYIGGVILPGVKVALNSLVSNTAQLPRISFDVPKRAIGKNTIECMRNGIMLGNAAMLDGLIDRMTAELGEPATLIATGGMARFITPLCTHKIAYDPDLLLRGLMILYRQNTETKDA